MYETGNFDTRSPIGVRSFIRGGRNRVWVQFFHFHSVIRRYLIVISFSGSHGDMSLYTVVSSIKLNTGDTWEKRAMPARTTSKNCLQ